MSLIIALLAQTAPIVATMPAPVEPKGSVIFYRGESIMGAALGCPVRYEGNTIVDLDPGKYLEWKVKPGRYVLLNKTASVEVTVEEGKTSYVRCVIKTGFMSGRSDLQLSDRATFEQHSADYDSLGVLEPSQKTPPCAGQGGAVEQYCWK